MNDDLEALTQPFLHKTITESSIDEIRAIIKSYPYFAPAQLALLKKLQQENSPEYNDQLQKSVLYYYDPLQFEAFIHSDRFLTQFDFETTVDEEVATEIIPETREEFIIEESGPLAVAIEEPQVDVQLIAVEEPIIEESDVASVTIEETVPVEVQAPPPSDVIIEPKQQEENSSEPIAFEPYHTVDYFASQGIKLTQQEEASTDRFGKQVKSFTEWLKTMKKLPAATMNQTMDPSSEHKVQHLAEHSIEKAEVVTEAMAAVWLKQGNLGKAIEVYNKLSLQNPSKKAYFAAKIDQLKKTP
jgi:hypothetical protein